MLVITRKEGESFQIGTDIKIVIVKVKGKQVQVGIQAPKDVSIVREDARYGKAPEGRSASQDRKRSSGG